MKLLKHQIQTCVNCIELFVQDLLHGDGEVQGGFLTGPPDFQYQNEKNLYITRERSIKI